MIKNHRQRPLKKRRTDMARMLTRTLGTLLVTLFIGLLPGWMADATELVPCLEYGFGPSFKHDHVRLLIFVGRAGDLRIRARALDANIGVETVNEKTCIRETHTFDEDDRVIHISGPASKVYTLGDFFRVWGKPLTTTRVLDYQAGPQTTILVIVNGRVITSPPENIELHDGTTIIFYVYISEGEPLGTES